MAQHEVIQWMQSVHTLREVIFKNDTDYTDKKEECGWLFASRSWVGSSVLSQLNDF